MIYLLTLLGWYTPPTTITPKPLPAHYVSSAYIADTMDIISAKLTPNGRRLMTEMLLRVTTSVFKEDKSAAESFIVVVAIESKFNVDAKSSVGAIGLAQIMKPYAKEFASYCNLSIDPNDIYLPEVNLTLGACLFKHLREEYGSTTLALAAYNAGKYSKQIKELKALKSVTNQETAGYITKYHYIREKQNAQ